MQGIKDLFHQPRLYIILLCVIFFFIPVPGWIPDCIAYNFKHANILHILLNLYSLWIFKPRWLCTSVSMVVAIVSGFILQSTGLEFIGLSGFMFAAISKYYVAWRKIPYAPLLANIWLLVLNLILGKFAYCWQVHIMCFGIGYIFWSVYYQLKKGSV